MQVIASNQRRNYLNKLTSLEVQLVVRIQCQDYINSQLIEWWSNMRHRHNSILARRGYKQHAQLIRAVIQHAPQAQFYPRKRGYKQHSAVCQFMLGEAPHQSPVTRPASKLREQRDRGWNFRYGPSWPLVHGRV